MNKKILTIGSCFLVISCSKNESTSISSSASATAINKTSAPVAPSPDIQNLIQHIVGDMSLKLAIGALSYGTDFCINNPNFNEAKCQRAKGKFLEKLQDDCSKIGTNFYFTIGTTSVWGECNVPVIYQLMSYTKSTYDYYDYDVIVLLKFSNASITKNLLQQMHLYAANYTLLSDGGRNMNNAQFVGKTIKFKIKLSDPTNYGNYDYSIIPNVQ